MKTIIVDEEQESPPVKFDGRVVVLSPKWTKCELAYHFVLDFNDNNLDIIRLICREFPLKQRDVFDILPDWRQGIFVKEKKCTNI